jgi:hypothetical protein
MEGTQPYCLNSLTTIYSRCLFNKCQAWFLQLLSRSPLSLMFKPNSSNSWAYITQVLNFHFKPKTLPRTKRAHRLLSPLDSRKYPRPIPGRKRISKLTTAQTYRAIYLPNIRLMFLPLNTPVFGYKQTLRRVARSPTSKSNMHPKKTWARPRTVSSFSWTKRSYWSAKSICSCLPVQPTKRCGYLIFLLISLTRHIQFETPIWSGSIRLSVYRAR